MCEQATTLFEHGASIDEVPLNRMIMCGIAVDLLAGWAYINQNRSVIQAAACRTDALVTRRCVSCWDAWLDSAQCVHSTAARYRDFCVTKTLPKSVVNR